MLTHVQVVDDGQRRPVRVRVVARRQVHAVAHLAPERRRGERAVLQPDGLHVVEAQARGALRWLVDGAEEWIAGARAGREEVRLPQQQLITAGGAGAGDQVAVERCQTARHRQQPGLGRQQQSKFELRHAFAFLWL